MNVLASIIIPVYNGEKLISKQLDSICRQINDSVEIIIVDDGSTDNIKKIINNRNDHRIKYIYKENGGVSSARNKGLLEAKGDFIIFADCDDSYVDDTILDMINNMLIGKYDLSCYGYEFINNSLKKTFFKLPDMIICEKFSFDELTSFLKTIPTAPWAKVYKRSIIIENNITFDLNVPYAEDTIFLLKYLKYCKYICLSSKIVYKYDVSSNENQASLKYYPNLSEYFKLVMKCKEHYCLASNKIYNLRKDKEIYLKYIIEHRVINSNFTNFNYDLDYYNENFKYKEWIRYFKRKKIERRIKNFIIKVYNSIKKGD